MKAQVISFRCVLKNKFGRILSSTVNRDIMTRVQGATMLCALADGLQDLRRGERRSISLRADQAYGFYDPKRTTTRRRDEIPASGSLKLGDLVQVMIASGASESFRVVAFNDEVVSLDANHPLAGQDLIFEIETLDARDATAEEISESRIEVSSPLH